MCWSMLADGLPSGMAPIQLCLPDGVEVRDEGGGGAIEDGAPASLQQQQLVKRLGNNRSGARRHRGVWRQWPCSCASVVAGQCHAAVLQQAGGSWPCMAAQPSAIPKARMRRASLAPRTRPVKAGGCTSEWQGASGLRACQPQAAGHHARQGSRAAKHRPALLGPASLQQPRVRFMAGWLTWCTQRCGLSPRRSSRLA